jgi:hypothetical protein
LFNTLGSSGGEEAALPGVTVVSVQRAGVFDATTIRGTDPGVVRKWLESNGYQLPASAEPAIRYYLEHGWVFVASKVRCEIAGSKQAALHPLLFTFAARSPVYPTRLTAVNNGACAIDLYVFGERRATARHFDTVRCDRVATSPPSKSNRWQSRLEITDPEVLALIGSSTVGTKLSARLSPKQMASDVDIQPGMFWRSGTTVFSYSGAFTITLNVALPLAVLGWLLAGASQGGWKVMEEGTSRWRWGLVAAAAGTGVAVYLLLPKVEVVSRSTGSWEDGRAGGGWYALWSNRVSLAVTACGLLFERGHRVHAEPANRAEEIRGGGHIEREVPLAGVLDEVAADDGRDEAADVAHHIHGAGERRDVLPAYVHAGRPGARQLDVIAEGHQGNGQDGQVRIGQPRG